MNDKLTAIMLKATDSGDYDKRLLLFSLEEGRLFATIKGVRRPNAKLKFCAQPFALCEYEIVEKNGGIVITGATPIEDMYEIALDPEKYSASAVCAEITEKAELSLDSKELFVLLLKTLKTLLVSNAPTQLVICKYAQKILSLSGFVKPVKVSVTMPTTPSALLDYIAYKRVDELEGIEVESGVMKKALRLICNRFCSVYETKLNSLQVYEKIIV